MKRTAANSATSCPEPTLQAAPILHPRAVYSLDQARVALGLAKGCLPREARLGRLRVSRRGGRYFTTGAWLLEWLESGELKRRRRDVAAVNGEAAPDVAAIDAN